MKVCVTGAAGFVGSHLSEALVRDGHEVVGIDSFVPYYDRSLKERNLAHWLEASPDFTLVEVDLRDGDLAAVLKGVDGVVHTAAMPGLTRSWSEFRLYQDCNLLGTQRLLEAARGAGVNRFVHISTSSVYGLDATGDEQTPVLPVSPYGVTKLAAEQLALAFHRTYDLPVTVLRLCPAGEVFNIGGGRLLTVLDALRIIGEHAGVTPEIVWAPKRPGDQRSTSAVIDKARDLLGYDPTVDPYDGLKRQVEWQLEERALRMALSA